MREIKATTGNNIRQKCDGSDCPLWNNDRMWCQHPDHHYPENDWTPTNDPFDTCPLKKQPIIITLDIE